MSAGSRRPKRYDGATDHPRVHRNSLSRYHILNFERLIARGSERVMRMRISSQHPLTNCQQWPILCASAVSTTATATTVTPVPCIPPFSLLPPSMIIRCTVQSAPSADDNEEVDRDEATIMTTLSGSTPVFPYYDRYTDRRASFRDWYTKVMAL